MFDFVTAFGIAGLAAIVAVMWAWRFGRPQRPLTFRLAAGAFALLALSATLAASGILRRMDVAPPPAAVMFALAVASAFTLGASHFGRTSADAIPLVSLVAFQSFRLPLELVMHRAATLGIMPEELSYSGYNFDIITGAGAVVLAIIMASGRSVPRKVLWAWNVWGCWCLAVIAFVAVASSPLFRFFGDGTHVNSWILFVPYVWLPAFLVPAAVFGHVVITRALYNGARAAATPAIDARRR